MNIEKIKQACCDSIENNKPFPEVLAVLGESGVERYHADLNQAQKTYYDAEGDALTHRLKISLSGKAPAQGDMEAVRSAIAAIQQRKIGYVDFLQRIFAAGITDYFVFLSGKQAVYVDRCGNSHVERFPQ